MSCSRYYLGHFDLKAYFNPVANEVNEWHKLLKSLSETHLAHVHCKKVKMPKTHLACPSYCEYLHLCAHPALSILKRFNFKFAKSITGEIVLHSIGLCLWPKGQFYNRCTNVQLGLHQRYVLINVCTLIKLP